MSSTFACQIVHSAHNSSNRYNRLLIVFSALAVTTETSHSLESSPRSAAHSEISTAPCYSTPSDIVISRPLSEYNGEEEERGCDIDGTVEIDNNIEELAEVQGVEDFGRQDGSSDRQEPMDEESGDDVTVSDVRSAVNTIIACCSNDEGDRLGFLLKVIDAHSLSLHSVLAVVKKAREELRGRERVIREQEAEIKSLRERVKTGEELWAWHESLREQETKLNVQRKELEAAAGRHLTGCLERVMSWERETSIVLPASTSMSSL